MEYLEHPLTGQKLNIFSQEGRELLKEYIKMYKSGGDGEKFQKTIKDKNGNDVVIKVEGGKFTVLPDNTTVEHTYYQQLNTDNNDITVKFKLIYPKFFFLNFNIVLLDFLSAFKFVIL